MSAVIRVEVVFPLPERQGLVKLDLPQGATVRDALSAYRSRVADGPELGDAVPQIPSIARFGHLVTLDDPLADGDRLDILRPLIVDPKEARRRRAALHAGKKPQR